MACILFAKTIAKALDEIHVFVKDGQHGGDAAEPNEEDVMVLAAVDQHVREAFGKRAASGLLRRYFFKAALKLGGIARCLLQSPVLKSISQNLFRVGIRTRGEAVGLSHI